MIEPGVYRNMPYADYDAIDAVRHGDLCHMRKSPAHFRAHRDAPDEDTAALRLGRMLHTYVLEPDVFDKAYVELPEDAPKRPTERQINAKKPSPETVAAIDWWGDWEADFGSHEIIRAGEYDWLKSVHAALCAADVISTLFWFADGDNEDNEITCVWRDEEIGVLCKSRTDRTCLYNGARAVINLKTCTDARQWAFAADINTYSYHTGLEHECEGISQFFEDRPVVPLIIAVEKKPPHGVMAHQISKRLRKQARHERREWLRLYAQCLADDHWPAYSTDIAITDVPVYAQRDYE